MSQQINAAGRIAHSAAPRRVIWMTSDHMRYDHIAAHGNPAMITPALDRLVGRGVSFSQCFAQSPLCMPSRCSFMTGLYPQQTGVTNNGQCLPPDFKPTVAGAFKAGGHQTVQIGKLHFQPHEEMDFDPRPRYAYDFDIFWPSEERGNYSDAYYHWLEGKYPQYADAFRVPRSSDAARGDSNRHPAPIDAPWQASHAGWIVETACNYLSVPPRSQYPQFMHLGFFNPHPPLLPVREAWEAYEKRTLGNPAGREREWEDKPRPLADMLRQRDDWNDADFRQYRKGLAAMVTEMDLAVAHFLNWLDRQGLLDDTLLIFSSDHGDFAGDHRLTHKGAAYYDGVMRVPLVLHWPGGLGDSPRTVDGLTELVDVLPTLLGLSGVPVPRVMPGRNLAEGLLAGRPPQGREDVFAYHDRGMAMLRSATHKYLRYEPAGTEVLFDLLADPDELTNIAPRPDSAPILARMRERMLARSLQAGGSGRPQLHPY